MRFKLITNRQIVENGHIYYEGCIFKQFRTEKGLMKYIQNLQGNLHANDFVVTDEWVENTEYPATTWL